MSASYDRNVTSPRRTACSGRPLGRARKCYIARNYDRKFRGNLFGVFGRSVVRSRFGHMAAPLSADLQRDAFHNVRPFN